MAGKPKTRADDQRGSAPGEHRGGRELGTPNKSATIARAERLEEQLHAQGHKTAVEMLRHYMETFHKAAQKAKPKWGEPDLNGAQVDMNPWGNEDTFQHFAKATVEVASRLAPYESPTFRSINIPAPPPALPDEDAEQRRRRFSLLIFDNNRQGAVQEAARSAPVPAGANGHAKDE